MKKPARPLLRSLAAAETSKPITLVLEGAKWSMAFVPDEAVATKQSVWLFSHETGDAYKLDPSNTFGKRPRQG